MLLCLHCHWHAAVGVATRVDRIMHSALCAAPYPTVHGSWLLLPRAGPNCQLVHAPETERAATNIQTSPRIRIRLCTKTLIRDSDSLAIRVPTCMILYSCEGSVLFYTSTLPTNNGYSDAYLETGHADETSERPGAATRH